MTDLRLDWCSYDAAKYACENWHYSGCMPAGKTLKIGVWEDGDYTGVVIYSWGSAPNIGEPYGLNQTEVCELTRVALDDHVTPVTRILSVSRKLLTDRSPGVRLVVSYADPEQDHDGTIYQADNWIYQRQLDGRDYIKIDDEVHHPRSLNSTHGTSSVKKLKSMYGDGRVKRVPVEGKHKYLYPLDDDIRNRVESLRQPYPDNP